MPFSITPDPAYLYMSPRHQDALGHLLYGTGQFGGFVQLTGEVGTGKTTVVRTLLAQRLAEVDVAVILNPRQNEREFLQSLCEELGIPVPSEPTLKTLVDAINAHLIDAHARGRRTVLIIDEAQNLSTDVLEQVRLLTNLETHKEKLLRIMLVGQEELSELLARPELRQLAQRITARYHLTPLSAQETRDYISHRLRVAGGDADLFTPAAVRRVHKFSRGIPRLINILCDRALLGAYAASVRRVTPDMVSRAAREATGTPARAGGRRVAPGAWLAVAAAAIVLAAVLVWRFWPAAPPAATEPVKAASAPPRAAPVAPPPATEAATVNLPAMLLQNPEPLAAVVSRLIRLWDPALRIASGENVCAALSRVKLECYKASGDWRDLGMLNRPAILSLRLPLGGGGHVLLRHLGTDSATLETTDGSLELPLAQLDPLWTGEYLMLWRREIDEPMIGPASQGDAVQWLRRKLALADGRPRPESPDPRFGNNLRETLRAYQQLHGLDPDGLAGTRTQIVLGHVAPAQPGPVLTPPDSGV